MPKTKKADHQKMYIVARMPAAAWDLLSETLRVDSMSTAFEPALRSALTLALSQVQIISSPTKMDILTSQKGRRQQ